ncbi:hypothetical protein RFI_08334 [Reticulomyxa filosa]|uniref:valine--tRNA ligase n=1 Tax=Reticulomyxa filosa TaxID=46433 RepID=X6NSQ3_RETFI|nr:hypothetical protein RFI_08334 [Reticulomyxa filosa]|eukprot:ETO28789.1 hypothetical protein RFI_08334 [Reticulomyxa filosa]
MKTDKESFVMVIPPPNVTGSLHLGHALMATIEDAITRYWRMKGKNTLWLPGTDHAGIATQAVVERRLQREGISKHVIGREKFLEEVWKWKKDYGGKICEQLRRMGCSVDWSREVFTMDDKLSRAVTEAFVRMYEKGLIYRANRLCHWSCQLQSAISNAEVEVVQLTEPTEMNIPGYAKPIEFGVLHRFKYPLADPVNNSSSSSLQYIEVATTRIETMLGDTAVAVHPNDTRYSQVHGRFVLHPFLKRKLPIVCDSFVDPQFGSGAVKITPAHDENDFECGRRHNLDFINILTEDGRINANGGDLFAGMPRYEARAAIIAELTKLGLFVGRQDNPMGLQICSRSKDVIEPYLKPQWYVNCTDMAKKALDAVFVTKELKITPTVEGERLWQYFLGNIRPWCISRQLWWGHRIPAWQVHLEKTTAKGGRHSDSNTNNALSAKLSETDMSHWIIARTEAEALEKACEKFGKQKHEITLVQDPDVLDTWFSSGLFPFSTMGWPDEASADLKKFFRARCWKRARISYSFGWHAW